MTTLVLLEATIKDGHWAAAAKMMIDQLPDTRGFPGCQGILCYRQEDAGANISDFVANGRASLADLGASEGKNLVLVEYWDSLDAYHRYVQWRQSTGALPGFVAICDGPPRIRSFEVMEG